MPSTITPGLIVLHGNQLELLRDTVLDWLRANPLDPLEPELMLVQSNGVAEWLKISLAERAGVSAAVQLMLPGRFLWQAYRAMLGRQAVPVRSPFDKAPLTWRLMRLLPELAGTPGFEPLARFLDDGAPERRLQLAQRLSDLFDQYQVYRADWLADWRAGDDVLRLADGRVRALAPEQRWQAALWRALVASVGEEGEEGGGTGRADIHRQFLAAIAAGAEPMGRLPRRVVLFGVSALPLQTLEALAAVSTQVQVLLAVPNPCQYHWGDIIDGRELLRAERRRQKQKGGDLSTVALEDLHHHSHPLLAGWGRQGRDFIRLLDAFDNAETTGQHFPSLRVDLFSEGEGATLLEQVQVAVRELRPLAEHAGEPPSPNDRSIEFHVTHSAQREVEVLHDQLLHWLAATPGLTPRDVVVMVPEIESFAPAIRAVFSQYGRHDPRYIPFEIADVRDRSVNPLLNALDWLLRLPTQRCRQSELRDLLDVPALAARFGLTDPEALPMLARWMEGAGVRWGLDQPHRDGLGLGMAGEQNSWLFGLRRMLLGYASGDDAPFAGIEPYAEVGGLDAALAGSLAQLVEALIQWRTRLDQPAPPAEWAERARALLQAFIAAVDERDRLTLAQLETELQRWLEACDEAGFREAVPLAVLREAWLGALDEPALNHRFVSGGVTFCTLMPMRAVPFRVVCLLGMNDGDYPRRSPRADFDLLREPGLARPGDRSRHDDDRYLMLEALLAARDKLYLSWVGRNIRDNTPQPPSLLVSQLRDYLAAGWGLAPSTLTTEHPLQPFSRCYFEQGGLTTYAREWRAAHGEPAAAVDALPPYTLDPEFRLTLRELAEFLRNPAKYFFRRRLGVLFADQLVTAADDEPFALDGLDQYQLIDTLLTDALLASGSELSSDAHLGAVTERLAERAARLAQAGQLPIGRIGARWQADLVEQLTPMCRAWLELIARYPLPADKQPLVFTDNGAWLEDWLDRLHRNGSGATAWLDTTASKLTRKKGKQDQQAALRADKLIDGWLRQLLAASQDITVSGLMVGRDALLELAPLAPDEARHTLRTLLQAWRAGMDKPLPTACLTGLAQVRGDNPAPVYEGGHQQRGEGEEPCLARLWPEFAELSAEPEWGDWSQRLYAPLADWLDRHVHVTVLAGAEQEEEDAA